MKNLIGKKVRGFKFENTYGIGDTYLMLRYVGAVGEIDHYVPDKDAYAVQFKDGGVCIYPAELIEHYIKEKELLPEAEVLLKDILKEIKFIDSYNYRSHNTLVFVAKQCTLLAIDFAEKILTEYGSETNELQNMDSFFHDLDQLKKEIEQLQLPS